MGARLIEIPAWGNITIIEAAWLLTGLLALGFTLAHIRELVVDYRRARETGRPVLARIAFGYVRREYVRMMAGAVITAIGIWAALEPPAFGGRAMVSVTGLLITAGFIAIAAGNALMSWWDWRDRETIQADLDKGANGHSAH